MTSPEANAARSPKAPARQEKSARSPEHTPTPTPARTRASSRRWRSASSHKLLLTLHIATSTGILGADLGLLSLSLAGRNGYTDARIYPAMSLITSWVLTPLAVTAVGTGLLLIAITEYRPLRHFWLTTKLLLTVTLTALVILVLAPSLTQAADAATQAAPLALPDARQARYVIIFAVSLALLVVNVALAVYKPSWPHRRRA